MIQVLPSNKRPSTSERMGRALSAGVGEAINQYGAYQQRNQQMAQMAQENEAAKRLGIDLSGIQDPKMRQQALAETLKNQSRLGQISEKTKQLRDIYGMDEQQNLGQKLQSGLPIEDVSAPEQRPLGRKFPTLPGEKIMELESIQPGAGKLHQQIQESEERRETASQKEERRKFEADRAFHAQRSDKIIDNAQKIISEAPIKKGLMQQQRRDIETGRPGDFLQFLVEQTGFEPYRDPAAARFKTAAKHRYVESLNSLAGGARLNQFLEKQLSSAQATLGTSPEAQMTVLDMEEFIDDMKEHRAKLELDLAKQDLEKHGFAKSDIAQRATEMMGDYAEKRQDEMAYDIRQRHVKNLDNDQLAYELVSGKVSPGTPLTLREARFLMIKNNDDAEKAEKEAKKLGYKIPLESTYKR